MLNDTQYAESENGKRNHQSLGGNMYAENFDPGDLHEIINDLSTL